MCQKNLNSHTDLCVLVLDMEEAEPNTGTNNVTDNSLENLLLYG